MWFDGPLYSGSIFVLIRLAIPFMAPQRMIGTGADMAGYVVLKLLTLAGFLYQVVGSKDSY